MPLFTLSKFNPLKFDWEGNIIKINIACCQTLQQQMISLYLPLCQGGQLSSHVGRQVRLHSGREEPNSATRRKPLAPRVAIGTLPPPKVLLASILHFSNAGWDGTPMVPTGSSWTWARWGPMSPHLKIFIYIDARSGIY